MNSTGYSNNKEKPSAQSIAAGEAFGSGPANHCGDTIAYLKQFSRIFTIQGVPKALPPGSTPFSITTNSVVCNRRLGGLLKYYAPAPHEGIPRRELFPSGDPILEPDYIIAFEPRDQNIEIAVAVHVNQPDVVGRLVVPDAVLLEMAFAIVFEPCGDF